jgi:hypothetical protein
MAAQLPFSEIEATKEMDTSFRNHPHVGAQDFAFELALALPDRSVPQMRQRQRTALVADARGVVGDLADVCLVVPGQTTAENPRHRFGLRSVAATLRRFCSV